MHIFEELKNSEIQHLIDENIHSQRDREIMKYKLIDGRTAEWIADKFDMNFRTVQRIIARNKIRLSNVYKKP
jgi:hypothetical protein